MRDVLLRPGAARTLAMLSVVTLLMVMMAVFAVSMQRRALTSDFDPRPVFPELGARVNEAAKIEITSRLSTVTIARDDTAPDTWRVADKGNHPARADMVKRTVVGLADLELIERRTAQPEWHKHINLTAPEDKGTGVRVRVFDAAGEQMASLIVGKLEGSADIDGAGTIYVRRDGEDQSYVARGSFNLEQQAANWLETRIIGLESGRVNRVDVTPQDGPSYTVVLAEPGTAGTSVGPAYVLAELPEGRQVVTDYAITGIGNALTNLQFTDVSPADDVTFDAPVSAVFHTDDGMQITVRTEKQAKTYYAVLDVRAIEGADADVVAEAQALSARLAPYAYALPTARGADLTRTLDVLTEPVTADVPVDLDAAAEGVAP